MPETPVEDLPLPRDTFSAQTLRSIDPKSPAGSRMMAAKGLIPGPTGELLSALYVLVFDPDPKIADTAQKTAASLPERLLGGLRDEDLEATVLAFYGRLLRENEVAVEMIALNPTTPDDVFAELAETVSEKITEIIAGNQLRILRDERIVRGLVRNPNTRLATQDTLLDFCVRSGLVMLDLPEYVEARRRIFGAEPEVAKQILLAEEHTAEKVVADLGDAVTSEEQQLDEGKRMTFTQRVMRMSVTQKIKMAALGNKEARTILLRDSNKLVAMAAVSSPRITDSEAIALSNSRTLHEEVMRFVCRNREWTKLYQVKFNLVNNPKVNAGLAMKFLQSLQPTDLKSVARNKNISSVMQTQAKRMIQQKENKK